ncbi:hypothetical protein PoB_002264400 [Plakobranchus ocellatus]|uniref:Uncharacterized protein n=1 Tax=Plakobranchus ocellatus TaxID=259542 RepID=A0AAV3ZP34_9GAST|nr:hypothetical protein PoB_002264400 [Plakobranchus ocellatus]
MKRKKAPGNDDITSDVTKIGGPQPKQKCNSSPTPQPIPLPPPKVELHPKKGGLGGAFASRSALRLDPAETSLHGCEPAFDGFPGRSPKA